MVLYMININPLAPGATKKDLMMGKLQKFKIEREVKTNETGRVFVDFENKGELGFPSTIRFIFPKNELNSSPQLQEGKHAKNNT